MPLRFTPGFVLGCFQHFRREQEQGELLEMGVFEQLLVSISRRFSSGLVEAESIVSRMGRGLNFGEVFWVGEIWVGLRVFVGL